MRKLDSSHKLALALAGLTALLLAVGCLTSSLPSSGKAPQKIADYGIPDQRPDDPPGGENVLDDTLVGQSATQIQAAYGRPVQVWSGYRQLGLRSPRSLPAHPIQTLIFRTKTGWLWIWLEQQGDWTCFRSFWHSKRVAID
jgi:hypothetical protein